MKFDLKYVISIYIILIVLLYFYNNKLFDLNIKNTKSRNKKIIYIAFLLIILAIISFYTKILYSCFFD
jgi:hypothetical protein